MLRLKAKSADRGSIVSGVRENASRRGGRRERESGQALVEFALILPLFIVLVVGIIQFGVGLNYWLDMQRIANQGARWAVVNKFPGCNAPATGPPCSPTLQQYLQSEPVSGGLCPRVDITFPATTSEVGDPVKVLLWTPFTFVPILGLGTINLSADATMRLEQKPGRFASGNGNSSC